MSGRRQRVTVPAVALVVQPAPDEVASFAQPGPTELITEVESTPFDRSEGRRRFEAIVNGWRFETLLEPADRAELRERAMRGAADHQSTAAVTLRAQMPGRVTNVFVADGEAVEPGQRLLAIEAMKMENEVRAPQAGTVAGLRVHTGARVERDDELLTIGAIDSVA